MTYKAQNFGVILAVLTYKLEQMGAGLPVDQLTESLLTIKMVANGQNGHQSTS